MKKFLVFLGLFLGLFVVVAQKVYAFDIVPQFVSMVYTNTLGLYQAPNDIVLYQQPDESSPVVDNIKWNKTTIDPNTVNAQDLFVVYLPQKNLGFMAVIDENENWVQVIYNNSTGDAGWIKKDDPYRFMTWINFYNIYARKYGLKMLSGVEDEVKNIHIAADEYSKIIGTVNMPQKINLHAIKGNWALVSVYDLDRRSKTGYIRWRSEDGVKYFFPDIQ